ncbi:MAG: HAMP domain-containing protein [Chloroflexi bacterium]|nr:HAMP domain-containing protein [Chloroflexota bacterium]
MFLFASLRWKLILAFCSVILITLFLAGFGFLYVVRGYQTELAQQRLRELAGPIALQVRTLDRLGATPTQIVTLLKPQADEMGLDVLLLSTEGEAVEDTSGEFVGRHIELPSTLQLRAAGRGRVSFYTGSGEGRFFLVADPGPPLGPLADRIIGTTPGYLVAIAAPQRDLTDDWLALLPSLSLAALLSLLVSVLVALFLSRSITTPILHLTRATERVAEGEYDQFIPAKGHDEVGRLAASFNLMARRVAESHRTLRDFLANISHELKTPLTSILGFTQAWVEGAIREPKEYEEAAQIIHQEAQRMDRLVGDLIHLSRIEARQMSMEQERLDLSELLSVCCKRFAWRADQAGLRFTVEMPAPVMVDGDAHLLEQAFSNVLDNALKHTPAGGAVTARAWSSGGQALVSIHNTGSVISTEELPRIFERFYQVDKARSPGRTGVGLGLAIAREIAEAHQGHIDVTSSEGGGTQFTIALPHLSGARVTYFATV